MIQWHQAKRATQYTYEFQSKGKRKKHIRQPVNYFLLNHNKIIKYTSA